MSKLEKAIAKLRQNPKNVRFQEIETILFHLGFNKRQDGTSHAIFQLGEHRMIVPHRKPFVKAIYVKLLLEELENILGLDDQDQD